jgi:secondary thiamine-phosphate synthase enzyme
MRLQRYELQRSTDSNTDIHDLSDEIEYLLGESGIQQGWILVFVPGSTAGITTIEFEPGAVNDLKRAIEALAPSDGEYDHNLRWGDGNGYSHVRAALLGPSLTLPISAGRIVRGTWQQIVLCDFDNRPRQRRIEVQIIGL